MAGCVWRAMRHAGIVGAATGSLNRISNSMLAVHGAGSLHAGAWRALSSASVTRVAAEWSSVPGPLDPGAPAASAYVNKVEATHKGGGYFKPDLVLQYHSSEHYNAFELGRLKLKQVRESFAAHAQDCGGSEVQIAALSEKVRYMTVHLQTHHKDHASRRGLLSMLERRKKLLMYLRRTNGDSYGEVIYRLGLKDKSPSEDRYLQHEPKKNAAKKKKAKN
mmetsp:Transcript_35435/g.56986  ORF Transcript_35435/g.56986 Transcript_35435/m.56986 type:complete len:220 (-) Transcript_35435:119-778(-)